MTGATAFILAGEGGTIDTNNYNDLNNRPKINNKLLTGSKTGAQLGIVDVDQGIENAGKILGINNEGKVTVVEAPTFEIPIDDTAISQNDLWSSSKTNTELNGKLDKADQSYSEGMVPVVNASKELNMRFLSNIYPIEFGTASTVNDIPVGLSVLNMTSDSEPIASLGLNDPVHVIGAMSDSKYYTGMFYDFSTAKPYLLTYDNDNSTWDIKEISLVSST